MNLTDRRGNPVSTTSRAALELHEAAVDLFHGYYGDPLGANQAALQEDKDFVMGHCFAAGLMLSTTERALLPEARKAIEAGEARMADANERERMHLAALRAWLEGDVEHALWRYGVLLEHYPRDSFGLQMAHLGDFYVGSSRMLRDRVARVLPHWDRDVTGYGFVLGMHAFGLEEMGEYAQAEEQGRAALDLNARDPWAIHAVAHVMEMQGRAWEGVRWLESRADDWAPDNGFAFHNWWHLALYYLDIGDERKVLELYDQGVRPGDSRVVLELVDATALLWRLMLRGVDVGNRWKSIADAWEPLAQDGHYAFNDMHAMAAFVAADRPAAAAALLRAQTARIERGGTNAMMTWTVGIPVCRALQAFGRGDWEMCVDLLAPTRFVAHRFGGSHAQRDLLAQTLLEAALRGGMHGAAEELAHARLRDKPSSGLNWRFATRAWGIGPDDAAAHPGKAVPAAANPAELASARG